MIQLRKNTNTADSRIGSHSEAIETIGTSSRGSPEAPGENGDRRARSGRGSAWHRRCLEGGEQDGRRAAFVARAPGPPSTTTSTSGHADAAPRQPTLELPARAHERTTTRR